MDVEVTFPGGKRVDARVGEFVVHTDQPRESGGDGTAPGPFDLFVASIGACAGIYVLGFCQARGLSTDGVRITQHLDYDDATKLPRRITLTIHLPAGFPEKYRAAVVRAAEGCKVKKTLAAAPVIEVTTDVASAPLAAGAV